MTRNQIKDWLTGLGFKRVEVHNGKATWRRPDRTVAVRINETTGQDVEILRLEHRGGQPEWKTVEQFRFSDLIVMPAEIAVGPGAVYKRLTLR